MTLATTQSPGESVIAAEPSYITPEQMLLLPDDGRLYELVDGQLVEKQMSDLAQLIANTLNEQLVLWTARTAAGKSFVEATFQCFPFRPQMVRRPDVAFISTERMSGYQWGQGNFRISPDLAVEVVSPNDNVYNLDRKIGDYFRAGVRRVWVVNPDQQIIRIQCCPASIARSPRSSPARRLPPHDERASIRPRAIRIYCSSSLRGA
jgi:Uma2 family endonuclease